MSGVSGLVRGGRSEFELPDEILSIIPSDPFEQLDLAKKITSMAITSKVSNLEAEVVGLRQKLQEMEVGMHELQSKASRFQKDFREADSRLKIVLHGSRFSVSPWITPNIISPPSNSTAGSPKRTSGAMSPTDTYFENRKTTLWYPSSQQSSAANSPPRGLPLPARTPRIDGKEFFRLARSRLSYEQFRAFLANVKDLNAQKQTRVETLRRANEIFGTENKDLYLSFQGLVTKNKS